MKFGVNTFLWTATFTERNFDLLPAIREHGFDGVEVSLFHPREFQAAKIRHALSRHGLSCTVCSVLDRQKALDFGAMEFVDLENDALKTLAASTWCSMSSAATSRSVPQA